MPQSAIGSGIQNPDHSPDNERLLAGEYVAGHKGLRSRHRHRRRSRHHHDRSNRLRRSQLTLAWSIAIGTVAGSLIGVAVGNVAIGVATGLALGLACGILAAG